MYYPIILPSYLLVSGYRLKQYNLPYPGLSDFHNVMTNLILLEFAYAMYSKFRFEVSEFSIVSFIGFYLLQDLYFYCVHKFIFHKLFYNIHKKHHSIFSPFHTWHCSHVEHFILNIGSVFFADLAFPWPNWLFPFMIFQQVFTSIQGHTPDAPHAEHHGNPTVHFGNLWLFDWLFG
jgi:hypothetical protein